jgi:hypothetical protein
MMGATHETHGHYCCAARRIDGGIHIPKASGGWFNWNGGTPRIVIAAGAVAQGTLKFER